MLKAKSIIRDLKHLKGNKVFGYYDTENQKETKNLDMSVFGIIRDLAPFEIDVKGRYGFDYDGLAWDDPELFEEFDSDNSYNWASAVVFTFGKVRIFEDDRVYTFIRFHRYGDVRGNYTDTMVLDLDKEAMLYKIMEASQVYCTIDYKGVDYYITQDAFNEGCIFRIDTNCDFISDNAYLDIDNYRDKRSIKKALVSYLKENDFI